MQNYIKTQQDIYEEETKRSEDMHKEHIGLFREVLNVLTANKSNETEKEKN